MVLLSDTNLASGISRQKMIPTVLFKSGNVSGFVFMVDVYASEPEARISSYERDVYV